MFTLKAGFDVIQAIALAYRAGLAVLLVGRHGVGKSELIKQAALELGISYLVLDLSLMEPPDLTGLPFLREGRTFYAPPASFPTEGAGLLAFEELNRCQHYMMAPCLQLLTDRRLNAYELPSGWQTLGSVNPEEAEYVVNRMDDALRSRFVQIEVVPDPIQWTGWAETVGMIAPQIINFVRLTPKIFDDPISNPRAWTYASRLLNQWEQGNYPRTTLKASLEGICGPKWAAAFLEFYHNERAPLTAEAVLSGYSTSRPMVQQWVQNRELDLVTATLELLKSHLKDRGNFAMLMEDSDRKKNARMFLYDLPADIKELMEQWLKKNKYHNLNIPRRAI